MIDLKIALEKYTDKLGTTFVDLSIQFAVNFMYQTSIISDGSESSVNSSHGMKIFPPAPPIGSETGHQVLCEDDNICHESSES